MYCDITLDPRSIIALSYLQVARSLRQVFDLLYANLRLHQRQSQVTQITFDLVLCTESTLVIHGSRHPAHLHPSPG